MDDCILTNRVNDEVGRSSVMILVDFVKKMIIYALCEGCFRDSLDKFNEL